MDYEAVRQGLEQAIPYNRYLGLEVGEVGITPLARTAEISYLKLARGAITATGTLGEGKNA
jgi:hypothetical protein